MNATALQQQLDAFLAYAEGDVLLWHDPLGACTAKLGNIVLPADVVLLREDAERRFELQCRVNDVEPDERILLYRRRHHRVEAGDWFADLEARAAYFEAVDEEDEAETPVEAPAPEPAPTADIPSLEQDYYTPEAFRAAAVETLGPDAANLPDALLASRLGFVAHRDCVIRGTWDSPSDYYDSLMQGTLIALSSLPPAVLESKTFYEYRYQHQLKGELLDYDASTLITVEGLRELEISEEDVASFAESAAQTCEKSGMDYFTVPWLRAYASDIALLAYELSDEFYESVLVGQQKTVSRGNLCGVRLFATHGAKALGRSFVAALAEREGSIQTDDLLDIITTEYGIPLPRAQLITLVRKANLHYSPEIDRIYASHEQFVREVE